jgi:hypothetical protein
MKITGKIEYEIIKDDSGNFTVKYETTVENEMAAMAMTLETLEHAIASGIVAKKKASGRMKQVISGQVDRFTKAKSGLEILSNIVFANYEGFIEKTVKHESDFFTAEVTKKDLEVMNEVVKSKNK